MSSLQMPKVENSILSNREEIISDIEKALEKIKKMLG